MHIDVCVYVCSAHVGAMPVPEQAIGARTVTRALTPPCLYELAVTSEATNLLLTVTTLTRAKGTVDSCSASELVTQEYL